MPEAFIHPHSTAKPHPHVWEVPAWEAQPAQSGLTWKEKIRTLKRIGNAASPVCPLREEILWTDLNMRDGQHGSMTSWCFFIHQITKVLFNKTQQKDWEIIMNTTFWGINKQDIRIVAIALGCSNYSTEGRVAVGFCSNQSSTNHLTNHLSEDSDQLTKWAKSGVLLFLL